MTQSAHILAFDIGAESGRAVLGTLSAGRLSIRELHRFPNGMLEVEGSLHWDFPRLFFQMQRGLALAARATAGDLAALAVDTWGVDFCLLAKDGSFVGLPYAYRDARTAGVAAEFYRGFSQTKLYGATGIQELPFNTVFQLYAMVRDRSPQLAAARDLLFMPDAFCYRLTGVKRSEFTIASTSQLYNPTKQDWDGDVLCHLGLPTSLFQEIVSAGGAWGTLKPEIGKDVGLGEVPVLATAGHDTAAAVAAMPGEGDDWAYISSGTWSLVGLEVAAPILTPDALAGNFTNEGGVGGRFRFLTNVMGLWLLQECRRIWCKERDWTYAELVEQAAKAPAFAALIDPDWSGFLNPPEMPAAIVSYCHATGQRPPATPATMTRVILESLALKYRLVLARARQVTGRQINRLHICGGGAQNELLCGFTAAATGLPVLAGPFEATAIGNIMVQAMGLGLVDDLEGIRRVVRHSFTPKLYEPQALGTWDDAYQKFVALVE